MRTGGSRRVPEAGDCPDTGDAEFHRQGILQCAPGEGVAGWLALERVAVVFENGGTCVAAVTQHCNENVSRCNVSHGFLLPKFFSILNSLIFRQREVLWRPRSSAAIPRFPPTARSALLILSSSGPRLLSGGRIGWPLPVASRISGGRSFASRIAPVARTKACSMAFSSSRTLPGQR